MGASVGGGNKFVSDINVTPFVDVMLVLLIIFMVATPMMSQGLDVDLPQTKQVEVLSTEADHMVLTVRNDGKMYLDEYPVDTMEDLEGYLQRLFKALLWKSWVTSRPWASKSSALSPNSPMMPRPRAASPHAPENRIALCAWPHTFFHSACTQPYFC